MGTASALICMSAPEQKLNNNLDKGIALISTPILSINNSLGDANDHKIKCSKSCEEDCCKANDQSKKVMLSMCLGLAIDDDAKFDYDEELAHEKFKAGRKLFIPGRDNLLNEVERCFYDSHKAKKNAEVAQLIKQTIVN